MSVEVTVLSCEPGGDRKVVLPEGFSISTEQADGGQIILLVEDEDGVLIAVFRDWRYAVADSTTPPDDDEDEPADVVAIDAWGPLAEVQAA